MKREVPAVKRLRSPDVAQRNLGAGVRHVPFWTISTTLHLFLATLACLLIAPAYAAFTDNGNGTVTDTSTGLMWKRCGQGQSWTGSTCSGSGARYTWVQASALTDTYVGYSDWRLPTIDELKSLIVTGVSPTIDQAAFPNTYKDWYWSSTPYAPNPADAWVVLFNGASNADNGKGYAYYVRLVRSGQFFGTFGLVVSKAGTGLGTVSSSTGGLSCGVNCSLNLPSGTTPASITLTATPASGSTFAGWSNGCTGNTCLINRTSATDNYSVTATFNSQAPQTVNQTISFTSVPALVAGGTGTLSANATSGLAVSFSSLTPTICSVSGRTIIGISKGICIIAADQAGNSSYNAATQVTQSITIGAPAKTSQTISFTSLPTVVVGGSGAVSATASSGLAVSYSSLTTGICTLNGSTVTGVSAGACVIAADQAGDNTYNAANQMTQSITVGAAISRSDCLFNWAEKAYSQFFSPAGATSATIREYYYRYYSATGNYLSIADNSVWVQGASFNNKLLRVGAVADFLSSSGCP